MQKGRYARQGKEHCVFITKHLSWRMTQLQQLLKQSNQHGEWDLHIKHAYIENAHANILTCIAEGGSEKEGGNSRSKQKGQPHHWGVSIVASSLESSRFLRAGIFIKCQTRGHLSQRTADIILTDVCILEVIHFSWQGPYPVRNRSQGADALLPWSGQRIDA